MVRAQKVRLERGVGFVCWLLPLGLLLVAEPGPRGRLVLFLVVPCGFLWFLGWW